MPDENSNHKAPSPPILQAPTFQQLEDTIVMLVVGFVNGVNQMRIHPITRNATLRVLNKLTFDSTQSPMDIQTIIRAETQVALDEVKVQMLRDSVASNPFVN